MKYNKFTVSRRVDTTTDPDIRRVFTEIREEVTQEHTPQQWIDAYGDVPYYHVRVKEQAILDNNGGKTKAKFGFGEKHEVWNLDEVELEALLEGKTLAYKVNSGEYTLFLKKADKKLLRNTED